MNYIVVEPPVDENGNINIHNQDGGEIEFNFDFDLTGRTFVFELSTGVRITLSQGTTANDRVLTYSQEQFSDLLNQTVKYALVDETDTRHDVVMEGEFKIRGY